MLFTKFFTIITSLFKSLFTKNTDPMAATHQVEAPLIVSVDLMNEVFPDRSAGRHCEHCDQHGSHHTDKHNEFASVALSA